MRKYVGPYTALVIVLAAVLTVSGYLGQQYVRRQIHREAVKQAALVNTALLKQQIADRYTINHTGCAIKKIVGPQLASLEKAKDDPNNTPAQRERARVTFNKTKRVLLIWTTIPPDFNCDLLPPQPPDTRP